MKLATSLTLLIFSGILNQQSFAQECSQTFSRKSMIFDLETETGKVPHSAYLIGLQVDQKILHRTIEEISGEKRLDKTGCIDGRCKAKDKVRFRDYLTKKIHQFGGSSYFEWERNKVLSGIALNSNPEMGPLNFKSMTPEFALRLVQAKNLNSVFTFFRTAKFDFGEESFRSIDADFVEDLISDLQSEHPAKRPIGANFDKTWGAIAKSAFLTSPVLHERLLRELYGLKDRLYAGEIAKNLARGRSADLLKTPEVINVISEIKGTKFPDEIIEVSAHYDTVPHAPGADDNGSGISAMMEMIRIFNRFPPQRTIRFVFTDLEENGKYGSLLHAKHVLEKNENLLAALVIDTIGYHPERESKSVPVYVLEMGTPSMHTNRMSYERARGLTQVIAWQSNRYKRGVRYSVETTGALPGTGDHGSYLEMGLPAVFAAAGFEGDLVNPGYHKPTDTIEKYNWPFFMDITRILTESVAVVSGAHVSQIDYRKISPQLMTQMNEALDVNGPKRKLLRNIPGKGIPKPKFDFEDQNSTSGPGTHESFFNFFFRLMTSEKPK